MSKLIPRPYQDRSIKAAINWIKKNTAPCLLDLATAAGKSVICALLADAIVKMSGGKKVLILCPDSRLVKQNAEAYALISDDYSIYSASIAKSLRHNVVIATAETFVSIADKTNGEFCCVIIDEADVITKANTSSVDALRDKNPNLRVIGMTGTPWRTSEGYIYEIDIDGSLMTEVTNPYYKKVVARVTAKELIELGYATPPTVIEVSEKYETENIQLNKDGKFNQWEIDEAFLGHGKKTSAVVQNIIFHSNRRQARAVIIYAATIDHCTEIMASLPTYNSAVLHGGLPDQEKKRVVADFKSGKIKYLVNVNMAAVGLSVNHVDILAFLRLTESSRFYTQALGRGMRLDEFKEDFWVLDYTANHENLFPDGDLFNPEIVAYGKKPSAKMDVICPECNHVNSFSLRPNPDNMQIDQQGYFLSLDGNRFQFEDGKYYPGHYGRRCTFTRELGRNNFERCSHFWESKKCHNCGHHNDIASRKCENCREILIDHNDKITADFAAFKNDLSQIQTDKIIRMSKRATTSKSGNPMFKVFFKTPYRDFVAFFSNRVNKRFYELLADNSFKPETVSYKKSSKSDFYTVVDFNRREDFVC